MNESGRSLIKAHYGRYYKAMEGTEFRPAVPSITPSFEFRVRRGRQPRQLRADLEQREPAHRPETSRRRHSDQFIVQFEQEVMPNLGVQVNYVHKRGADYGAWQDITGVYQEVPYIDNQGVDATGNTVMVYRLLSNPADRIFMQTNPDGMAMRYNGVTMMATKRMSNNWLGVISLVLSKSEGRLGPARARRRRRGRAVRRGRSDAKRRDRTTS